MAGTLKAMAPDELALTLDAQLSTLGPRATTIAQNPHSTIEPTRGPVDSQDNVAVRVLTSLAARSGGAGGALEVERTLGEGGMGIVHLATQVVLGRKVAVKTLKHEHRSGEVTLRLLQEAWITGALEHPNVVPVYDIALDAAGGPMIVLKRIEGVHWGELMHDDAKVAARAGGHDRLEWNLRVLAQVCNAVHFAHSRGVVHRDLKPENVMIGEFEEVYVLDWGLAVTTADDAGGRFPRAADARDIAGTPCYMAPEMLGADAVRNAAISERTDVYLLGAMLFEILTGRPPHLGADLRVIMASILLSPPRLPESVPDEIAGVCRRAMSNAPAGRFATADELRRAVLAFLEHRGSLQLSARADARRVALLAEVRRGKEAHDDVLYDLLGECRFGYRAALDAWADNAAARRGLDEALASMAGYELDHGTARDAAVLLAEMTAIPAELTGRLEEKRRAETAEAARVRSLERLGDDLDPRTGARTRLFLTAIFTALWTIMPMLAATGVRAAPSLGSSAALFGAYLGLALALGLWAKDSLTKTLLNRRLYASVLVLFTSQLLLLLGCALLDVPMHLASTMLFFEWFVSLSLLAIFVDLRLTIAAVIEGAGFLVSARWPDLTYAAMSAAGLAVGLSLGWIWWPLADPFGRRRP